MDALKQLEEATENLKSADAAQLDAMRRFVERMDGTLVQRAACLGLLDQANLRAEVARLAYVEALRAARDWWAVRAERYVKAANHE